MWLFGLLCCLVLFAVVSSLCCWVVARCLRLFGWLLCLDLFGGVVVFCLFELAFVVVLLCCLVLRLVCCVCFYCWFC